MSKWLNEKLRWGTGRWTRCRWNNPYIDWANYTGDEFNRPDGSLPDPTYWEQLRNDQDYAEIQSGKINYSAPSLNENTLSRWRLRAYLDINFDFDIRLWFSGWSSQVPASGTNYGPTLLLYSYPDNIYRAQVARIRDTAYNGYLTDSDLSSSYRFNFSTELSGAVRLHKENDRVYASRYRLGQWLWDASQPINLPVGVEDHDFYIIMGFQSVNNTSLISNIDKIEISGNLIGV